MSAAQNSLKPPLDYIARLEARLEIDKIFTVHPDDESVLIEKILQPSERHDLLESGLDGIGCRDETIKLQAEALKQASDRKTAMLDELNNLVKHGAYTKEGSTTHGLAMRLSQIMIEYAKYK